jgi:aspartyl-tRNA(Asn)/glutamyl-tRNA(Gln) amidotransferase subunit B
MSSYTTTVGIEVHAELTTASKMFCGCKNDPHAAAPNTHTCPICMGHPGTLPAVNAAAVEKVRMVGVAIGAELADFSEFDRKNYFYPDIPKAYQISQYAYPLVTGGAIAGVAITRIHLEEDTARSQHNQGSGSLVDFNRAGVPLMELVTEPVIHSATQAGDFARELQLLLQILGVSDANMERGEMRVEANISVSKTDEFGTKVEVKNLNSFKAMEAAIEYETKRQIELLESGGEILQETRGWDDAKGKTFAQRSKETANDYRYFPDPDIPKYQFAELSEMSQSRISEKMPILPNEIRNRYRDLGISDDAIEVIVTSRRLQPFFWMMVQSSSTDPALAKLAANYLVSDVAGLLQADGALVLTSEMAPRYLALMQMLVNQSINSRTGKDLLPEVLFAGADPEKVAKERGLLQLQSIDDLLPLVQQVIAEQATVVAEYQAGKEASLKFLVGQAMKLSRGTANPQMIEKLLKENIA